MNMEHNGNKEDATTEGGSFDFKLFEEKIAQSALKRNKENIRKALSDYLLNYVDKEIERIERKCNNNIKSDYRVD